MSDFISVGEFLSKNLWVVAVMVNRLGGDVTLGEEDLIAFGDNTLAIHETVEGLRLVKMPNEHALALSGECREV